MKHAAPNDAATTVDQLLAHAELSVSPDDRSALIDVYPHIRAMVARLRIDEARTLPPATIFTATRSDDSTKEST